MSSEHVSSLAEPPQLKAVEQEDSGLTDVSLSVRKSVDNSERTTIGSCAAMLRFVSEYFAAMVEGDSVEKGEIIEWPDRITLPGMRAINAIAFGALSKVKVTKENLGSLMVAAQYCRVPSLSEICDEFVKQNSLMKNETIVATLLTDLHKLGLTQKSNEMISQLSMTMLRRVFLNDQSVRMSVDLLSSLLKSERLVLDEESIWEQCTKWARYQASVTDEKDMAYLAQIKPLIRFPLMSEEFIAKRVMPSGLLTLEEMANIILAKYEQLGSDVLFCSSEARIVDGNWEWDQGCLMSTHHSISEDGLVLSHDESNYSFANAFVNGQIKNEGTTSIEIEQLEKPCFYGVIQATEKPKPDQYYSQPLKGVGYHAWDGNLYSPKHSAWSFGEKISEGDRLRMTVTFSDPSHATLVFHKNGTKTGKSIKLHSVLDLKQGLRFAVQTQTKGSRFRICPS